MDNEEYKKLLKQFHKRSGRHILAYGINRTSYIERIKKGWTLKDALTKPIRDKQKEVHDHLGNTYSSVIKMCKAYGITRSIYDSRIKRGWDLENVLTTPIYNK